MKPASRLMRTTVVLVMLLGVVVPGSVGGESLCGPANPRAGGPDGNGDIPNKSPTGPGSVPSGTHDDIATPTAGLVVDALTRKPITGALVIVTDANGIPVAAALTDLAGKFLVYLFHQPDLELAIPSEGVAGIEVHAGEALLVMVP